MGNQRRGILMALAGIIVMGAEVVEVANHDAEWWNFVAIATGAFLLFSGFATVARAGRA
jgi:uncharacterized membrane protein YdcZ (DUF606 family)